MIDATGQLQPPLKIGKYRRLSLGQPLHEEEHMVDIVHQRSNATVENDADGSVEIVCSPAVCKQNTASTVSCLQREPHLVMQDCHGSSIDLITYRGVELTTKLIR